MGAALGGRPDRRQAGAVRGDRGRDHARQLQAAAVAARLSRPLARPRLAPTSAAARSTSWRSGCASRRRPTRMEDLGTLTLRYAANEPDLAEHRRRRTAQQAGLPLTFQSRNRAIVFAKPHATASASCARSARAKATIAQLATVIGLWNFAEKKDWEIYRRRAEGSTSFPHRSTASQRILIRDGVELSRDPADRRRPISAATSRSRSAPGVGGKAPPGNAVVAPALTISMFNLRRAQPVPLGSLDLAGRSPARTYGGLRAGAGRRRAARQLRGLRPPHRRPTRSRRPGTPDRRQLEVAYRSGSDLMEAASPPTSASRSETHFAIDPGAAGEGHSLCGG